MPGDSPFQTLQKMLTVVARVDALTEKMHEFKVTADVRLDRLEAESANVRERVARLEACRDADHARAEAEMARFKTEVERAELRLTGLMADARGRRRLPKGNADT